MPRENIENHLPSVSDANDSGMDTRKDWQAPHLKRLKLQDAELINITSADGIIHS
jgi:hypothetical protein